jgi:hypothetical protein
MKGITMNLYAWARVLEERIKLEAEVDLWKYRTEEQDRRAEAYKAGGLTLAERIEVLETNLAACISQMDMARRAENGLQGWDGTEPEPWPTLERAREALGALEEGNA